MQGVGLSACQLSKAITFRQKKVVTAEPQGDFCYISNNVFPQPLSEAEESSCLQLLKQG